MEPTVTPTPTEEGLTLKIVLNKQQSDMQFIQLFNKLADNMNKSAVDHGFWEEPINNPERIALMHSELSEALEALRLDNPPDDKIPEFSGVEAEMADCVIRIMDFCKHNKYRLAEAILAKHQFNLTRPFKHGKKF